MDRPQRVRVRNLLSLEVLAFDVFLAQRNFRAGIVRLHFLLEGEDALVATGDLFAQCGEGLFQLLLPSVHSARLRCQGHRGSASGYRQEIHDLEVLRARFGFEDSLGQLLKAHVAEVVAG